MWAFKRDKLLFLILIFIINSLLIFYYYSKILNLTENYFTYPLDDTYIHLAMAKNFINYKVIGINGQFASTTSSPLFTFLISFLFLISGDRADIPLIINIIISFILLFYVYWNLAQKFKALISFFLTIIFYLSVPVPTILFLGMEHLLHILFVLIFLNLIISSISEDKKNYLFIFIFSFLCAFTRYESIFLVFPFLILFIFKKKIKEAILIFSGTLTPILIYGFYSLSKGWYFLPNSLMLKGFLFNFGSISKLFLNFGTKIYNEILMNVYFIPVLLFCLFLLNSLNKDQEFCKLKSRILSFSIFLGIILHLYLAKTGWLYRYEAYLIGCSFILFVNYLLEEGIKFKNSVVSKISLFIILFISFLPVGIRSYNALKDLPLASRNIYEQQIQMAKFLQKYYKNDWVGVNDIGAVCYFKEKVLDIWGLGDIEITKMMLKHLYDKNYLEEKINQKEIKILVVYEKTFEFLRGVPEGLILAGQWQIKDNRVCGFDTISFFAKEEELQNLIRNLKEYSFVLPKNVIQKGLYLN